jgi:cytochrome d ubiquinol oxidase subunit I
VGISLMAFVIVYFLVFGTGIYYMLKLMRAGPALPPHGTPDTLAGALAGRTARCPTTAVDRLVDAA